MSAGETEIPNAFGGAGGPEYAEHSQVSRSKKVIPGPMTVPGDPAASPPNSVSLAPIQGTVAGSSASLTLLRNKAYRVISSTAAYFRLSVGSSTAVVGDIYLPANTPIIISTAVWDHLSFIQVSAGGIIQALEVQ